MHQIIERIRIKAPVSDVYAHCTRFAQFPQFVRHMRRVEPLAATRLRWHAAVDDKLLFGEYEITEQSPPERIAWRSTSGHRHAGTLELRRLSDRLTEMILVMAYDLATMQGGLEREVKSALAHFKDHVERSVAAADSAKKRIPIPVASRRARRIAANALSTSRKQWTLPH